MGNQFVVGIADDGKLDMVQLYLVSESKITFPLAKAAVIKAFSRIGRASPFDVEKVAAGSSSKPEVSQGEVNAELLEFFRSLRATQRQQPVVNQYVQPVPPPPPSGGYQKPAQQDQGGYRSYPKPADPDLICHNCLAPGHYSTNCPEPQVGFKQRSINRAKVEEMKASGKTSPLPQQAPAAAAAAAQLFQEHLSPKAGSPLSDISGNVGRALNHLPMTPVILQRGQTLESLPRYPSVAAVTQKVRFEGIDDNKENDVYPDGVAAPANRVQKRPTKAEKQQPRRDAKKVADRVMSGPPRMRGQFDRIEDVTDEMEGVATPSTMIDDQTSQPTVEAGPISRVVKLPLPPTLRSQPTVEEVEDEQLPRQPRPPSKKPSDVQAPQEVQFIDLPAPSEPQRKLNRQRALVETYEARPASPSEPQYDGPKETVAINMAKDRSRFQVSDFLDAPVTLPIWQLLDRSPQIRAQLARAMASSKPSRRGKKATVAVLSMKGGRAPAEETEAHEEEEVVCLYILSWVKGHLVKKTLADTGAVVELINPKLVELLDLQIFEMDEEWTLQLADDRLAQIKQYVWVPVNVAGVVAVVRAFILGMGDIYDVLLSKRWMRRVRAIEDHGENTLTIRGKDGVRRVVQGTEAEPLEVELIDGPSVDEWETAMAEDEIARLADELDGYDYNADQEKAERQ